MTQALVVVEGFSSEKIDLVRRTVAKDATNDELALFLHQAHRTGLDPLSRQIHFSKYKANNGTARMSIITGIDGYRLVADRTGKYAGSDDYRFDDGVDQYTHMQSKKPPVTATATVYKLVGAQRVAFTATAAWSSYVPPSGRDFMWQKMPYLMLGKCAEALALRKAFPAELSGLYVREEMEQAGVRGEVSTDAIDAEYNEAPPAEPRQVSPSNRPAAVASKPARPFEPDVLKDMMARKAQTYQAKLASDKQRGLLVSLLSFIFAEDVERHAFCKWLTGESSTKKIDGPFVLAMLDWLGPIETETGYIPSADAEAEGKGALAHILEEQGQLRLPGNVG